MINVNVYLYKQYGNKIRACSCAQQRKKRQLASFDRMGIVVCLYFFFCIFILRRFFFHSVCNVWTFLGSSFQFILINSMGFISFCGICECCVLFFCSQPLLSSWALSFQAHGDTSSVTFCFKTIESFTCRIKFFREAAKWRRRDE